MRNVTIVKIFYNFVQNPKVFLIYADILHVDRNIKGGHMTSPISNNPSINSNYAINNNEQAKEQASNNNASAENNKQAENTQAQVSGEETLGYMDAQAASMRPVEKPRVLNISQYVTPEQAQRIIGSILNFFEPAIESYLSVIDAEIGDALSAEAKLDLAREMFEAENL